MNRTIVIILMPVLIGVASAQAATDTDRKLSPIRAATPEQNEKKIALVIGNAAYKSSPLKNPVNDARAMSTKLKELGFDVIEFDNLTQKQIGKALREFRSRLEPGAAALFFYAGHGLQVKGINYLPAVDAEIESEDDIPLQSLEVGRVLDVMAEAKTRLNLVFLDACRNNPYASSYRSAGGGLAKVEAPSGTMISFATRPGSVARDGEGKNGLYTANLLSAMDVPSLSIERMLKRVASGVKQGSNGLQEPWSEGAIEGEFSFRGGEPSDEGGETAFWNNIKNLPVVANFDAYLSNYPNGLYVPLAKETKARLEAAAQKEAQQHEEEERRHEEERRKVAEDKQRLEEERREMLRHQQAMQDEVNQKAEELSRQKKTSNTTIFVPPSF